MVIVITGGSSGIGLETAKMLANDTNNKVYVLSRRNVDITNVISLPCDITKDEDIEKIVSIIKDNENSKVDLLINNAGMGISGAIENHELEDIEKIISVNFTGLVNVTRKFIPLLRNSKGMIVNVSSVAGAISIPFQTMYSATKSAVLGFSNGLRNELRPYGVRVTSVLPGDTKTGFTDSRKKSEDPGNYGDRIEKSVSKMEKDERNGVPASKVAKLIYKVSKKKNPNTYYVVGTSYRLLVFLSRILPKRLANWIIYRLYAK